MSHALSLSAWCMFHWKILTFPLRFTSSSSCFGNPFPSTTRFPDVQLQCFHRTLCILTAVSCNCCCSVAQLCLTLWSHGLQHGRFPCLSLSPGDCSNSCPFESVMPSNYLILCHPLLLLPSIFSSIRVFSSESALHIKWPKYWRSASVLSMNIQGWFPLRLTGLISLQSKGLSRVFSSTVVWKHQFFGTQPLSGPTLTSIHDYCDCYSSKIVPSDLGILFAQNFPLVKYPPLIWNCLGLTLTSTR